MLQMNSTNYKPGMPVKISCLGYSHYAIVSDRYCVRGKPKLISLSRRTGTVLEEPWDDVVRGRRVTPSFLQSALAPEKVLARAKNQIGVRKYNLLSSNCEHFVRESLGLRSSSRQIEIAAGAGLSTLLLVLRFARGNPYVGLAATTLSIVIGSRFSAR